MRLRRLLAGIGFLSVTGLAISLYLTYIYTTDKVSMCLGTGGCDTVQHSPYAWLFGIPIPVMGAAAYFVLLLLTVGAIRWTQRREGLLLTLFGTALAGLLFSAYLTFLELFVIDAICLWCVASAIVQTGLFVLVTMAWRRFQQEDAQLSLAE